MFDEAFVPLDRLVPLHPMQFAYPFRKEVMNLRRWKESFLTAEKRP